VNFCVSTLFCAIADVVEIKHICLPPSSRDYKDIYVVFELMETDLHQVIALEGFTFEPCCDSAKGNPVCTISMH